MTTLDTVRQRLTTQMRLTAKTLGHILRNLSAETATTLRDGPQGWTVLEVVCHLRDFDLIFADRVKLIRSEDEPKLTPHDHEAMAIERNYNGQDLAQVFADLSASREVFAQLFEQLSAEEWERAGIHPERGRFTITDAALQVVGHDLVHLEQITRILVEGVRTEV